MSTDAREIASKAERHREASSGSRNSAAFGQKDAPDNRRMVTVSLYHVCHISVPALKVTEQTIFIPNK